VNFSSPQLTTTASVTQGNLAIRIDVIGVVQNPMISGIEIILDTSNPTPVKAPVPVPVPVKAPVPVSFPPFCSNPKVSNHSLTYHEGVFFADY
jgi:hypothetical protein